MKDKNTPRKVIYDTDMGSGVLKNEIDDGYGLLLCLALDKWREVDLLGVTVVMGNTFIKECVASLLSKIIRNQIIMDENRISLPRHAREGGHPVILSLSSMSWIPASAGMTDSGP